MRLLITFLVFILSHAIQADEQVELYFGFTGNDGDSEVFLVDLPEQVLELTVETSETSGDVDIFVFQPDEDDYLDFSYCLNRRQGSNERCQIGTPRSGQYQVKLSAFQPDSSATLRVAYTLSLDYPNSNEEPDKTITSDSKQTLLKLDHTHLIEISGEAMFKTYVHPNREYLTFVIEPHNEDLALVVNKAGTSDTVSQVCHIIATDHGTTLCDIAQPDGLYYITVTALNSANADRSQQHIQASLGVFTEVDNAFIQTVWQDPEVKALAWETPKTFTIEHSERTYFYEATPHLENLKNHGNENWNGFVVGTSMANIAMGFGHLSQLSQTNCGIIAYGTDMSCHYNLNTYVTTDKIRVKVDLPTIKDSTQLLFKETTFYGKPSPRCPIKNGCNADPDP